MDNSINNRQPSYAGVNITCNVIDPTKLPPDSPLLQTSPQCTVDNGPSQMPSSYPGSYYTNNYGYPYPPYPMYPAYPPANTKQKRIQVITDDYIKNLENFLNNPNEAFRIQAANDILQRFDEDKTRYNDAALNALLNKMLQDPCHKVKMTALVALETQLAQGNQNTAKILQDMAKNDKTADGADALKAAKILLNMSSPTELIYVPCTTDANKGS